MSDNNFLQISTDYKSEALNFAISKWCNKVVFKLCVVEFCSEILLLIPKLNQTCAVHSFNFVWFQTKLHSTQFNYHDYSSITTWTRWYWHCKDRRASEFYISNHKWWDPNKYLWSKKIKSCHSETSWPQNTTWPQNISWKLLFLWLWKIGSSVFFLERSVHTIIIFYKRFIVGVNAINYQLINQ